MHCMSIGLWGELNSLQIVNIAEGVKHFSRKPPSMMSRDQLQFKGNIGILDQFERPINILCTASREPYLGGVRT
jgi:hypothetical protein